MADDRLPEQVGAWLKEALREDTPQLGDDLDLALRHKKKALRSLELVRRDLPSHINPHDLTKTGWGVIFPPGKQAHLETYLRPLLKLRKMQAGDHFSTFTRHKNENGERFLRRHNQDLGVIRPEKVPYYLLIVASPEDIPFEFQYHLSLSRAVGRIWFEKPADFTAYAEAVCEADAKGTNLPRQATIFSVENDKTTKELAKSLVEPVRLSLKEAFPDWEVVLRARDQADKDQLQRLLGGGETPGLLLVSCHGKRIGPLDPERQRACQGAPVCQDGMFTAGDLAFPTDELYGLISFFFSCYGAGTPELDNFPHEHDKCGPEAARRTKPRLLAKRPFLARLPVELLRRGALAAVGHVDHGWTTAYVWRYPEHEVNTTYSLEDSLWLLLRGHRLGHAMRPLNRRYAQLAARLAQKLDLERQGVETSSVDLAFFWTAVNDARNLVVLGDPAVYLRGRRDPEVTVPLDWELLRRIERLAAKERMSVEAWIYDRFKNPR